ncbi:protein AF-17 isoform X5 [Rhineura floridana]|uniref:protein AF-17 isoform X5 n=1 Tax=Rhineura floridana TaxID=261503 RepID=UPI002AC83833|nr:protein AF-17 isoform X5 [Rhineura floridana]XP_061446445.1 protein AF-17 isoform X5 [Rhineura floridana]XP_061446446.1 protein AF-17 isoform X5 [Rhineura floridana]XP_061446447.1 protein AF-17 isoform X5 [Rhineura floridana]
MCNLKTKNPKKTEQAGPLTVRACYGIVQVPTGPWFCRKCESQERAARVRCELCPHKDGALKRTDNGGWAHVVCALYIPEVQFANVLTMEPIVLQYVPHDRFNKTCYICEEQGRESKAASGACMTCNRHGCRQAFHVTCAQMAGLLCEEEVLEVDNVKYCGYCKYHFNKMKTSRHSGGGPFITGRRSRSASPAQEKHVSHHEKPKKSRKDKERPKQKHKKSSESPTSLTLSSTPVVTEKQSSTNHHESSKETSEVIRSEVKGKKSSSHGTSHKAKKSGSGKSSAGFGSSSSSGTFTPAGTSCSSLPFSQDFVTFPKLEQQQPEEEKYRKPISSSSSSAHCSPLYEGQKSDVFEQKVIFSGFGSIMRFSTSAISQQRGRDASPVDYKVSNSVGGTSGGSGTGGSGSSHKRMPFLNMEEGEVLKEKKHKASKKSKHGPGRPKGSKNKEVPGAQLVGSTATSSSPFSGGSLVSSSIGGSSRIFSHVATLPSLSLESPLLGSGIYTSNKDPISHGGGVLRTVCSTPLSSSLLAHQGTSSLPQLTRSPFASTIPTASSSSVSTTQVFSLAGSTFSLPPSHIFGSPLTSGLSINPLLNQSESNRAEPDLEDCNFACRGSSPQESLSSMSPISSLPTLFDQTVSTSSGQLENVPQATPNIEQLLEKQGNGEAGVNIVEMLKALHSLQKENQRLQEQIMTLAAKKERLQLLNVQLSVPFPVVTTGNGPAGQAHYILASTACNSDSLSVSKSPPCKNSFGIENSLSTSSEDPHSGCPSRSSSSLSFHSTPPPLPLLQQSPASLPLTTGMQHQQPPVNGLARAMGTVHGGGALANHSLVDGLLGSLAGGQQVPINGILGGLNGAVATQTQNPLLAQSSGPPNLQLSTSQSSLPSTSHLTEQQQQLLSQPEFQLQQLQQLLTSQPLNPEQQALVFQMIQQIQQKRELQRLQMTGSSQLPMTGLGPATSTSLLHSNNPAASAANSTLLASISPQQLHTASSLMASPTLSTPGNSLMSAAAAGSIPPVLTAQTNPFLSLQGDSSSQKGMSMNEKGGAPVQDKG